MDLQTLNDLKIVNKKELKKLAIKWIKECRKEQVRFRKEFKIPVHLEKLNSIDGEPINWIKHFFNITNDDLNNQIEIVEETKDNIKIRIPKNSWKDLGETD